MKKQRVLLLIVTVLLSAALPGKSLPAPAGTSWQRGAAARIQLAILLDTSGSMDGLIDQAKSRLWKVVNELATARKNGKAPRLQVALYEYGQSSLPAAQGYLRCVLPLSEDLDRVSEELFKLRTNGGDEYCGRVIAAAAGDLAWSAGSGDLKLIFIAGNEPFTQGATDYRRACREAIGRGIVVNTIFCGSYQEGVQTEWKAGADLADGQYVAIDADNAPPPVSAPQDEELARLGRELNGTYVAFGRGGAAGLERQRQQDKNAAALSGEVLAQRAAAKAAPQYTNSSWDLLDAKKAGAVKLEEMSDAELPREMKGMTVRQRHEYVAARQKQRDELQKRVTRLSGEREQYVRERLKSGAAAGSLDDAILRALRAQAAGKNFSFGK